MMMIRIFIIIMHLIYFSGNIYHSLVCIYLSFDLFQAILIICQYAKLGYYEV